MNYSLQVISVVTLTKPFHFPLLFKEILSFFLNLVKGLLGSTKSKSEIELKVTDVFLNEIRDT